MPLATDLPYFPVAGSKESVFRRLLRHFDWTLFTVAMLLSCIGLVMVYSASLRFGNPAFYLGKQALAFAFGCAAIFVLASLNYQIFAQYAKPLYVVSVGLLMLVLLFGSSARGTKAWLALGPLYFQPSEISKLIVIVLLAAWCEKNLKEISQIKTLFVPALMVLSHMGLILLQPDFGSTLVYLPIAIGILFVAGARLFHLLTVLFYAGIAGGLVLLRTYFSLSPEFLAEHPFWNFFYKSISLGKEFLILQAAFAILFLLFWWIAKKLWLRIPGLFVFSAFCILLFGWCSAAAAAGSIKEYQRKRIIAFFDPAMDPAGSGYHAIQSMVALGSGKIFGKGIFSGTQGRLGFLPEQHTDFIFSVLGEELGFAGCGFVVLLYFILQWRAVSIAGAARDRFGSFLAIGISCMFGFYIFLNLMMIMGWAPVIGLPLPFLSYGGSSLVSSLAAVGILLSIHVRRYTH